MSRQCETEGHEGGGGKEEVIGQGEMPVMQGRRLHEPARLSLVPVMHMEGNNLQLKQCNLMTPKIKAPDITFSVFVLFYHKQESKEL